MQALGQDPEKLTVLLLQMVSLYRGGELVKMSKRTGQSVTLNELIEEVGTDAARYFFLMRSLDSQLDFDLDLAKKKSNDNPVYYIQPEYLWDGNRVSNSFYLCMWGPNGNRLGAPATSTGWRFLNKLTSVRWLYSLAKK